MTTHDDLVVAVLWSIEADIAVIATRFKVQTDAEWRAKGFGADTIEMLVAARDKELVAIRNRALDHACELITAKGYRHPGAMIDAEPQGCMRH